MEFPRSYSTVPIFGAIDPSNRPNACLIPRAEILQQPLGAYPRNSPPCPPSSKKQHVLGAEIGADGRQAENLVLTCCLKSHVIDNLCKKLCSERWKKWVVCSISYEEFGSGM